MLQYRRFLLHKTAECSRLRWFSAFSVNYIFDVIGKVLFRNTTVKITCTQNFDCKNILRKTTLYHKEGLCCRISLGILWHTPLRFWFHVRTRPCVNYAKDWLDQLFLIPGLVWCGKGYHLWDSQKPFSCVLGHFRHGDKQATNQVILVQARLEICRNRRDRRSCKIFVSCVNFSRKQRGFLLIWQVITHLNTNFIHNC